MLIRAGASLDITNNVNFTDLFPPSSSLSPPGNFLNEDRLNEWCSITV